jgi:hypothetical protein
MDWQFPLVLLCLAAAVVYLGRRAWRTWSGRGSGCGVCKCAPPPAESSSSRRIPLEQISLRRQDRG